MSVASVIAGLGWHAWVTLAVVAGVLVALVRERVAPHWVMLAAVALLAATGVVSPGEALAGLRSPSVLAVGVLFVVVGSLRSTGAIRWVAEGILGRARTLPMAQVRLVSVSSFLSAFINNTPVVAMLTAAVQQWSRQSRVAASKLLLPLSYATILGGMCTLIGTSTNLVIKALLEQHAGLPRLHMFDPAWTGVPAMLVGWLYLLTVGRWLLPERRTAIEQAGETQSYVVEMEVLGGGGLAGRSVVEAGLRHLSGLFLVELQRRGRVLSALDPDTVLETGDRLVFVGNGDGLRELRHVPGLRHAEGQVFKIASGEGRHLVEAVMSRWSPAVGKRIREGRFRNRYGAVVVAVNRHGQQLRGKPGDVLLQAGDTLLLEATPSFIRRHADSHDFLMVNLLDDSIPVQPRKATLALALLGALIVANSLLHVDVFVSAALAALALLATRCITLPAAWRALDIPLLVVIGCAFALGSAIEKTGLAAAAAQLLMATGGGHPLWTLALVYGLTVVFTELITNNAAAVLMLPIGLAAAAHLGVHPMPFVMAVMTGASASFITPIGYQTNMMVYGPGGYRFMDYVRVGTPLSLLVGVTVLLLIPLVWPF